MIVGHYSTALIAHQKFPKGTLLFFLIVSQVQDFMWFILHYFGIEHTTPSDAFDATIPKMYANMLYSHDLVPQILWAILVFIVGRLIFKDNKIALVGTIVLLGHYVLDFFSGHPHYIFGEETHEFGLGLYETNPYLAIGIEAVFSAVTLWYFFSQEAKNGIQRTFKNKAMIIGVFVYGIVFMLSTATVSLRETLGIPEFDLGFNTLIPTLLFTYIAMLWILNYAIPKVEKIKSQS